MAQSEGVAQAFLAFAAEGAILNRGGHLIKGKEGIRDYFAQQEQTLNLKWSPDFVDVSDSGDLVSRASNSVVLDELILVPGGAEKQ